MKYNTPVGVYLSNRGFNRLDNSLIHGFKKINLSILYCYLVYRQEIHHDNGNYNDGFFKADAKNLEKYTSLNRAIQIRELKKLADLNLIDIRYNYSKHRYIKVNQDIDIVKAIVKLGDDKIDKIFKVDYELFDYDDVFNKKHTQFISENIILDTVEVKEADIIKMLNEEKNGLY